MFKRPKICVSLAENTAEKCISVMQKTKKEADLFEIRADFLKNKKDWKKIVRESSLPTIVAFRASWEGGKFKGSERSREALLKEAASEAEIIDVELDAKFLPAVKKAVEESGASLLVSKHDFSKTPSKKDALAILEKERKAGADLCKFVATAKRFADNTRILEVLFEEKEKTRVIAFCMGGLGVASRILSPLFGASFTFACTDYGKEAAPGQVSVHDMREIYKVIARKQEKPKSAA